jgi:SAM-dependent methyltransferase
MGLIGGTLGYEILRKISPAGDVAGMDGSAYKDINKLEALLGTDIWHDIKGKVVVDFGCGEGGEAIEMAQRGARRVIGVDLQENLLEVARRRAFEVGLGDRCSFTTTTTELADIIVALDSFEHFSDPSSVLVQMSNMLKPDGCVIASFGPTWLHPLGGHLFSIFPWAHLIFSEKALIRWRSDFKSDGATRFNEVAGGLNQLTIRRFEHIVEESPFKFAEFETVPIRKLKPFANRLTREVTTAIVRCKLILRG